MRKFFVSVVTAGIVIGITTSASAALLPDYRCAYDAIGNQVDGLARRNWAKAGRNANPYLHTIGYDNNFWSPASATPTEIAQYQAQGKEIYPSYVDKQYDPWKPVVNPVTSTHASNVIVYIDNASSYSPIPNTDFTIKPDSVMMDGYCIPGCYTPDQNILFRSGFIPIEEAFKASATDVITLAPDATFDALSFITNEVASYTVDRAAAEQTILIFRTESGGELKVTVQHPLLSADGTVRTAQDFRVGEPLLREDGSPDIIRSIDHVEWVGKAYNLKPRTTDLVSNIVIAQGFLNGSVRYQQDFLKDLNRVIFRANVPEDAIPTM